MGKKIAKRALPMALAATMIFTSVPVMAAPNDLDGHWAEKVMTEWQEKGLINGYEDGTVKPDNAVSRAEFVTMMNKAMGLTEGGAISFSDVKESDWYYDAVATAVAAGYCRGYDDGTFKPGVTINRAEAAVMLANAAGLEANSEMAATVKDAENLPAWAMGSIGAVMEAGFMSGYPDGTFGATASFTRAETVSSLDRAMDNKTEAPSVPDVKEEVTDVVVEETMTITDQTITGDLVIDEDFDGKVLVENTVIESDVIVKGCGTSAIVLEGVTVKGTIIIDTENAKVQLKGDTTVNKVEVTEDAAGAKVEVAKDATVETVVADAKVTLTGSGTIETLEANADGITVNKKLDVADTEVADGVKKPTTSGSSGGGGGSSSGGSSSGGSSSGGSSSGGTVVTKTEVSAEVDNPTFEFVVGEAVGSDQFAIIELTGASINAEAGTDLQVTSVTAIAGLTVEAWTTDANGAARGEDVIIEFEGSTPTTVTEGAVTYTVTIPASMLTVESNYQATKDLTVTFTVEVKDTAAETLTEVTSEPRYEYMELPVNDEDYENRMRISLTGATISESTFDMESEINGELVLGCHVEKTTSDTPIDGLEMYALIGFEGVEVLVTELPTETGTAVYTFTVPKEYLVVEEGYKVSHDLEVQFTVIAYGDATTATVEKWNEIADSLQASGFEFDSDGYMDFAAEIDKLDTEGYKVTAKLHTWNNTEKIAGIYLVVMNENDYEDLVKKSIYVQKDPETVNKMTLYAAIDEAESISNDPWVSEDGSDVVPTEKWVTQSEYDELETAITAAQKVYDAEDATQETVDATVTELNTAVTVYKNAMKDGLYGTETEEPDTEVTEVAITEVTMSNNTITVNPTTKPAIEFTLENVTETVEVSAYVTTTEGTPAADVEPTDYGYVYADEEDYYIGFEFSETLFGEAGTYYVYYKLGDGEWVKADDVITVTEAETPAAEETSVAAEETPVEEETPAEEKEVPAETEETTI